MQVIYPQRNDGQMIASLGAILNMRVWMWQAPQLLPRDRICKYLCRSSVKYVYIFCIQLVLINLQNYCRPS